MDTLPARFVSSVYIIDVTHDQSLVRYQGAELIAHWGVDRTGEDLASHRSKRLQEQILSINKIIVRHPCGYTSHSTYTSSRERVLDVSIVRLPLTVQEGRPPRVIACVHENDSLGDGEYGWEKYKIEEHGWLDIGAGIPPQPPIQIIQ